MHTIFVDSVLGFFALIFAHLIFDWCLQTEYVAKWKAISKYVLLVHSFVWGFGIYLVGLYMHILDPQYTWVYLITLIGGHYMCDWWKATEKYKPTLTLEQALLLDQAFHLFQIFFCVALVGFAP